MPDTFVKIATVTVGSTAVSSMDFNSIPSTYTDLCLKISSRSTFSGAPGYENMKLIINSATGSSRVLFGTGSTAGSTSSGGDIQYLFSSDSDDTSNTFGNTEVYIPNYASSIAHSVSADSVQETNASAARMSLVAGLTSSTSAITSISIQSNNYGNFVQYSTATLYGISKS